MREMMLDTEYSWCNNVLTELKLSDTDHVEVE